MNKKLLRKIQRAILREPKRYNQDTWCDVVSMSPDGSCGTVGCIAGWACAIELGLEEYVKRINPYNSRFEGGSIAMSASRFLDLDVVEGASSRLFHVENWPKIFNLWLDEFGRFIGRPWTKALLAVLRIEIFIWSNGKV